jgi:hypothetical protein
MMWRASYQFSKSIDDAGTGGRGQGNTPVAQNWLDLSAERALSGFDSRHNLTLSLQYSTGMGTQGGTLVNGWKGTLLKDWTVSSDITLRSGNPFTATVGGNLSQVSGTAVGNIVRAQATGLAIDAAGALFNTSAFTQPLAGEWGDAGRNTIPGPTAFYLNSSLGRIIRLGEHRSVDLQVQAPNILNHVTVTSWGTVLGASNYGIPTNAAAMRKITFNLRFRFGRMKILLTSLLAAHCPRGVPVARSQSAAGRCGANRSRRDRDEEQRIARKQWKTVHKLVLYYGSAIGAVRGHHCRLISDIDRLLHVTRAEREVDGLRLCHLQRYCVDSAGSESSEASAGGVIARRNGRVNENPVRVGARH